VLSNPVLPDEVLKGTTLSHSLFLWWLRDYATNRKVACSIPNEVIFKFT
jgi:hypothetical protein